MGNRVFGIVALAAIMACTSSGAGELLIDAGEMMAPDATAQPGLEAPCLPHVTTRSWEDGYSVETTTTWIAEVPADTLPASAIVCDPVDYAPPTCPGRATCEGEHLTPLECARAQWEGGAGVVRVHCGVVVETTVGMEPRIVTGWRYERARVRM